MSLFGIGSGDKKTQTTNTSTTTTQTDSSKNVGGGAILLESGASIVNQDVSETVARDALAGMSSVANNSVAVSAALGDDAIKLAAQNTDTAFRFGAQVASSALDKIDSANVNTQLAAQNSVSYARQLAELGFAAKADADTGGLNSTLNTAGKWLAVVAAAVGVAFIFRRK